MNSFILKENQTIKEKYFHTQLENGFRITVVPKKLSASYAMVCCGFGGADLEYEKNGERFTLPAGTYKSLNIRLGKAAGKNWWCVVFPAVCIPAATDRDLSKSVNDEGVKITSNPQKYVMKFKAVEIFEDIKKLFNS